MAGGEVFSAFVRFFVKDEVSKEAKNVEQAAEKAADGMDEAADAAGNRLAGSLGKAKTAASTAAKGLAGIGAAVTAGVAGMFALVSSTEEVRENMAKLDNAFEASGNSVEAGRKAYSDFYGLVGDSDQATEAAQNLARLTNNQEELNQWTNISAGAFAAFGDALPVENLTETADETAATGVVVGSMADALNWSTASAEQWSNAMSGNKAAQDAWNTAIEGGATKEDAFNAALAACTDEQERATLITAALNGVYGEQGEKYLENNKALIESRQAQADWNNAMGGAAAALLPATTALQQMGAELLNKALPYLEQFSAWFASKMPQIKQFATDTANALIGAWEAAQPVIQPILSVLAAAFQWFIDHLPQITAVAAPVIAALMGFNAVTAVIGPVTTAFNFVKNAISGAKIAFGLLKAAFIANPFGMIITIVTTLIGIFIHLWNTNEDFRNAVINIWNAIKNAVTNAVNSLKNGLTNAFNTIKSVASSVWNGIKSVISSVVNAIYSSTVARFQAVFSVASSIFNSIRNAISNAINGARDAVSSAIGAIKGMFNFSWRLPDIQLPHFNVQGGSFPYGLGGKGTFPQISIDWYAKAMNSPMLLTNPTIFGMANGQLLGGGEAGAEVVSGADTLMRMIRAAVADAGGNGGGYVANINVTTGETSEDKLAKLIARENKRAAYALGAL